MIPMPSHSPLRPAPLCECGEAAVNDIYNGMHNMPVCTGCWNDPEAIATEVTVQYEMGDGSLADLTRSALVRRGRFDLANGGRGFDALVAHIALRLDEWY